MFSEMISTYGPAMVAAAVLVPVFIGHVAMFIEGFGERKWDTERVGA